MSASKESIGDHPAFARPLSNGCVNDRPVTVHPQRGMTYHQWLVGMALQGLLADPSAVNPAGTAAAAINFADATIAELEKRS